MRIVLRKVRFWKPGRTPTNDPDVNREILYCWCCAVVVISLLAGGDLRVVKNRTWS